MDTAMLENKIMATSIKRLREQKNMTQSKLAGLLFVIRKAIAAYETEVK